MSFEIVSEIYNAELHWYEAHGIGRREIKRKRYLDQTMKQFEQDVRFVICVNNTDYPVSLELFKVYRVLPDEDAAKDGDIRVIDESGEDYLYPGGYFVPIEVPHIVEQALLRA